MEKYDFANALGEGAYGCVFKARNKVTGDYVAIKKVSRGAVLCICFS